MKLTAEALRAYRRDRARMAEDGAGKVVFGRVYLHVDALDAMRGAPAAQRVARDALRAAQREGVTGDLVALGDDGVSVLAYPGFATQREPRLVASARVPFDGGAVVARAYGAANPPVLHRKELTVPDFMRRPAWARRTQALEAAGLFGDSSRIGRLVPWREALRGAGMRP